MLSGYGPFRYYFFKNRHNAMDAQLWYILFLNIHISISILQKHGKEGQKKKSTTPKNVKSVLSKQMSSATSSGHHSNQKLDERKSKVAFTLNNNDQIISLEDGVDMEDQLPATQPVDDRVLKGFLKYSSVTVQTHIKMGIILNGNVFCKYSAGCMNVLCLNKSVTSHYPESNLNTYQEFSYLTS